MIGAGCGIGEHNLSQHSVKWCEKSGLGVMERELAHGGDYMLGSELTLADFYMLPCTFAFGLTDEGQSMYRRFPSFCRWREAMENLSTTRRLRATLPARDPIPHAREWATSHRPKY